MAEREATASIRFIADLSDAETKYSQFLSKVQSTPLAIPISSGGSNPTLTTLGGLSVPTSATTPMPWGSSSVNPGFFSSQMTQQFGQQMQSAMQQMMMQQQAAIQAMTAQLMPTASPNWSYLMNNQGGPGGGGGGRGNFGGMRGLFIGGMLARSFVGIGTAARQNNIDEALAGDDPRAQLSATLNYRDRLSSSVPLVGGLYDFLADPTGDVRAGIDLTKRGADETDDYTSTMREGSRRRRIEEYTYREAAMPRGYMRDRLSIEAKYDPAVNDADQVMRDKQVEALRKKLDTDKATIGVDYQKRMGDVSSIADAGGKSSESTQNYVNKLQAEMEAAQKALDDATGAAIQRIDDQYRGIKELRAAAKEAELGAVNRARTGEVNSLKRQISGGYTGSRGAMVDRMMRAADEADPGDKELNDLIGRSNAAELGRFDLLAGNAYRVTTGANMARARGDVFGASMLVAGGEAFSTYANADSTQRFGALGSGLSGMYAHFMEGVNANALSISEYGSEAGANSRLLSRDPLGASIERITGARDRALFPLRNSTFPGAKMIRDSIGSYYGSQERLARQQFSDQGAMIDLRQGAESQRIDRLLSRDVGGAEASDLMFNSLEEFTGLRNAGRMPEAMRALSIGQKRIALSKKNFVNRLTVSDIDTRFNNSLPNGDGVGFPEQLHEFDTARDALATMAGIGKFAQFGSDQLNKLFGGGGNDASGANGGGAADVVAAVKTIGSDIVAALQNLVSE